MNRMTRAVNTLLGRPVDRPPVCFWHHFGDIGPEATVREHVRFYRAVSYTHLTLPTIA